jgi:hypothetical protein
LPPASGINPCHQEIYMSTTLSTRFARKSTFLRSSSPLGESALMEVAPSIFAPAKHESRSERYTYIPTIHVLRGLQREGFQPFFVAQSRCRIPGKSDFTKHMLRLRREGVNTGDSVGLDGAAPEIILINSHDGTSSYQMIAGLLEWVCMNGLVAGEIVEDFRVPHKGDVIDRVIEAAYRMTDQFGRVAESRAAMQNVRLTSGEQLIFAQAAAQFRFGTATMSDGSVIANAPVLPEVLNEARRAADIGDSLWKTFNRVQENVIVGGLDGRSTTGRRVQTRQVQSIDRNVSINRALWTLAEGMKTLKAGGSLKLDPVAA